MFVRAMLSAAAALMVMSAHASEGVFDSKGVKIRYVTEGEGEAVVLIHGWMSDATMWGRDKDGNPKLGALPGFKVIALDCRGHGQSDKPHEKEKYGAEMAEDVVRLLEHLKVKRAHLVGYSMGAFIVGKVAATHPECVISAIYGGQVPLLIGESGSREIDVFAKAVDDDKGMGPYLIEIWPSDRPKPTLEFANGYSKMMFKGKDLKAFAAAGLSFKGLEVRSEDLARCKAPSLFIYGDQESANLKSRVAALQTVVHAAGVTVVPGANHVTTPASPVFGASLLDFVKAHRERSR